MLSDEGGTVKKLFLCHVQVFVVSGSATSCPGIVDERQVHHQDADDEQAKDGEGDRKAEGRLLLGAVGIDEHRREHQEPDHDHERQGPEEKGEAGVQADAGLHC